MRDCLQEDLWPLVVSNANGRGDLLTGADEPTFIP